MKEKNVRLGKIVAPLGIKGEVKIYNYSDGTERYAEGKTLLLQGAKGEDLGKKTVESSRLQGNTVAVKFFGVDDRNAAEGLRNCFVGIEENELEALPEDTFYVRDLEGMEVFDFGTGKKVGVVKEVIQNTAQEVYRIGLLGESRDAGGSPKVGEALVPAVKEFVKEVDLNEGRIDIAFIPGMLPEGYI